MQEKIWYDGLICNINSGTNLLFIIYVFLKQCNISHDCTPKKITSYFAFLFRRVDQRTLPDHPLPIGELPNKLNEKLTT